MTDGKKIILVTGGSGYIAGWVISALLHEGFAVRATLRDLAKADLARANIGSVGADTVRLDFVATDLLDDAGWDEAMCGVGHVAHIASPVMAHPDVDTVAVAVEGTRRVLGAAARAGVERVVVTSSAAAARPREGSSSIADETVWTDLSTSGVGTYARSKTLAEQAAWDFARAHPSGPAIATILPAFVLGPMLGTNASATLTLVDQMLTGKMLAAPRLGFTMIDVRDLAALHATVLTDSRGAGERWIAGADYLWMSEVASILRDELGDAGSKAPTRTMPDWLVRLLAIANAPMKPLLPDLGVRRAVTSAKAERVLGWHPRPARDAVLATAESIIAQNISKPPKRVGGGSIR